MASLSSRVRAFSTASRGLLKLKRHPYSQKLAVSSHQRFHMISRYPKAVPSPAFFGSFTTTRRFLSTTATPTETPQSDSNPNNSEAEESDLETDPIESHEYGNKPLFLCYFFEDLWPFCGLIWCVIYLFIVRSPVFDIRIRHTVWTEHEWGCFKIEDGHARGGQERC